MKKERPHHITSYRLEQLLTFPELMIDIQYTVPGTRSRGHHPNADLTKAHRHEFYTLAVSGAVKSRHMVDFRQIDMLAHSLFLLTPGQVHLPLDPYQPSDIFLISFTPDFLLPGTPPLPVCLELPVTPDAPTFKEIWHICEQLFREFGHRRALQQQVLQHYLALLLSLFSRCLPEEETTQYPQPALHTRYLSLLEMHVLHWTSCGDYARALHVTADHLNEIVKQYTGQTASALLAARRILEAKRLLLHSGEGIKEIAWCLQFNEVTYFNRFFKQHTGQTPAAFRISTREKYNYTPE